MIPIHSHFDRPTGLHVSHVQRPFEMRVSILAPRFGHLTQVVLLDEAVVPLRETIVAEDREGGLVAFEEVDEVPFAEVLSG